jgi:hypothetical protein
MCVATPASIRAESCYLLGVLGYKHLILLITEKAFTNDLFVVRAVQLRAKLHLHAGNGEKDDDTGSHLCDLQIPTPDTRTVIYETVSVNHYIIGGQDVFKESGAEE